MFNFEGGCCFIFAIGTLITLLICHCPSWNYWKACDRASYGFCPLILIGLVAAIYRHDVLFFLIPVGCTMLGVASVAIRGSLCREEGDDEPDFEEVEVVDEDVYEEVF